MSGAEKNVNQKYHLVAEYAPRRNPRGVVSHGKRLVILRCPCGERDTAVSSPPHEIDFDGDGVLNIGGSVGSAPRPDLGRPENWCHFFVWAGVPEMCADAKCPGALLK